MSFYDRVVSQLGSSAAGPSVAGFGPGFRCFGAALSGNAQDGTDMSKVLYDVGAPLCMPTRRVPAVSLGDLPAALRK